MGNNLHTIFDVVDPIWKGKCQFINEKSLSVCERSVQVIFVPHGGQLHELWLQRHHIFHHTSQYTH
jgi:hypothetical protein